MREDLQKCQKMDQWTQLQNLHKSFSTERQALITPYFLTDDEYAMLWEKNAKAKMQYSFDNKNGSIEKYPLNEETGLVTEKGELVRSKSKKILADKLYLMGIPYVYEKPLHLNGNSCIFPDFTVLNKFTREEFYWEHFGMMDNPEYADKAVKKIYKYHNNHIYERKKLITTYDTSLLTLNTKTLEALIRTYLLPPEEKL